MRAERIRFVLLGLFATGVVACTPAVESEPPRSGDTAPAVPTQSGHPDSRENAGDVTGWIEIPQNLRFRGLVSVERSSSWETRLAKFSGRDQNYLNAMNDRYYGSISFDSAEQQQRLIAQGFPMPEEWLAARDTTDAELERLAKAGNTKARMFQVDRVSERMAPVLAERGLRDTPEDKELFRLFTDATQMAESLLRETQSPFAAYLAGRVFSAGTQGNRPEAMAGAFQLAKELGDPRADEFRSDFMAWHPGMDAESVMVYYASFKGTASRAK